jgi:two-component system alkaline phosphatase synthesis response regulator PhoP
MALELANEAHPAVVLLDILMPGIDGVEVCRRLDHGAVKVVIITARDDPLVEDACKEAGADAFLTKPFSSVELLDLVAGFAAADD